MTENNDGEKYIKFEDEGALDTFIGMSGLRDEQVDELRERVKEHGYGHPIPVPDEPVDNDV